MLGATARMVICSAARANQDTWLAVRPIRPRTSLSLPWGSRPGPRVPAQGP